MNDERSSTRSPVPTRKVLCGLVGLVMLLTAGCSLTTDLKRPKSARVSLDGPASSSMEMIVSTNFLVVEGSVSFVDADTTLITPPHERTYSLGVPARIYFKAVNAGDQTDTFALRVWIGGESWYNESRILAPEEHFEFVYRYDEPGIR